MDVTNGITWIRGLELNIIVIPEVIYIQGGRFECLEGDSIQLPNTLFTVQNNYYQNKIIEYDIVEKPKHGFIYLFKKPETPIQKFTKQQYENGLVQVMRILFYFIFFHSTSDLLIGEGWFCIFSIVTTEVKPSKMNLK